MSKCLIDVYCECNDRCEIYKCEALKMYQQGREDAIDECIEALGNNIWDIAKLEQLKEQKN